MGNNSQKIGHLIAKFKRKFTEEEVAKSKDLTVLGDYLEFMGDIHPKSVTLAKTNPKQKLINQYLFD